MIDWIKPSGAPITTNDQKETVAYCESLGWKRAGELFNLNDMTVEKVNGMSGVDMKKLIKQFELGVDKTLNVPEMRAAVIDALFEPEDE